MFKSQHYHLLIIVTYLKTNNKLILLRIMPLQKSVLTIIVLITSSISVFAQSSRLVRSFKLDTVAYDLYTIQEKASKTATDTVFYMLYKQGTKDLMVRQIKQITNKKQKKILSSGKYQISGLEVSFENLTEDGFLYIQRYVQDDKGQLWFKTATAAIPKGSSVKTSNPSDQDLTPPQQMQSVESLPEYPGGLALLRKFIGSNLQYPVEAQKAGVEGTVFTRFIVGRDGNVRDIEIERGLGSGCDQEVVRILKKMPRWKAAISSGKAVNCAFKLPISFKLTD